MGKMTNRMRHLVPFVKGWWGSGAFSSTIAQTQEGALPKAYPWNWWQMDLPAFQIGTNPAVEACVMAYAQVMGMMPIYHWKTRKDGGRDMVTDSPAANVLRRPNQYQTRADFILNLIRGECLRGNGFAAALRRDGDIESLHLISPNSGRPIVDPETRGVFYAVGENVYMPTPGDPSNYRWLVPARDMLHLRLAADPDDPLVGITPLASARLAVATNNAIGGHEASFFTNMSRPSGYLSTPLQLTGDQMKDLRERWAEQSVAAATGGVPILGWDMKWYQMSMTSQDAEMISAYKMSIADIARVYRVPLPVIGEIGGITYSNTESLINSWLAQSLGYMLEHAELAFDWLFQLPPGEYTEFDTESLLRLDFVGKVDGLTKGISGGLFSPNEARRQMGRPDAEYGDEPRLQAQVVPLSQVGAAPATSAPAAPAASGSPPASTNPTAPDSTSAPKSAEETPEDVGAMLDAIAKARESSLAELRAASHPEGPKP